jgi:hypothetical protein
MCLLFWGGTLLTPQITPYIPETHRCFFGEFGWSGITRLELYFSCWFCDAVSTAAQNKKPTKGTNWYQDHLSFVLFLYVLFTVCGLDLPV